MAYTKPATKDGSGKRSDGGIRTLVEAEKLMQIAVMLPSAAFVGWLLGLWLDKWLHTGWIALFGIIFGGFAGLFYVVRLVITTKPSGDGGAGQGSDRKEKE